MDLKENVQSGNLLNKIPCQVHRVIESPFEWSILIETRESAKIDEFIWWKVGDSQISSEAMKEIPEYITVDPEDIIVIH